MSRLSSSLLTYDHIGPDASLEVQVIGHGVFASMVLPKYHPTHIASLRLMACSTQHVLCYSHILANATRTTTYRYGHNRMRLGNTMLLDNTPETVKITRVSPGDCLHSGAGLVLLHGSVRPENHARCLRLQFNKGSGFRYM